MKKLLISFLITSSFISFAQQSKTKWMLNPYDEKVFTENKGQLSGDENKLKTKILFSFEQGNTTFFLCNNEFIVREEKANEVEQEGEDEVDPATHSRPLSEYNYLRFYFDESNTPVIEGEKRVRAPNNYYLPDASGSKRMVVAASFREVVYKNIYNGIDVIFSAHEKNGMKYHYVVHPFADASLIKINYFGNGTISSEDGNIRAGEEEAEVIDYAPQTFYADDNKSIPSSYFVNNNSYSFALSNYDRSRTIIIDPWIVNPNFTDQNKAFDIASDSLGFVYAFGGHNPWKLKKFDQGGNLLWTYNTPFLEWYGALAVDPRGNSYITDGCCSGTIQQIDSTGNVGWTRTNGTDEYWRLAFNCDFSKLVLGTGYASSGVVLEESVSLLDTASGAISNSTTAFTTAIAEPRSLAWGLNGNLFSISCTSNEVTEMTPAFTPVFTVPSGYGLLYNGPLYANGSNSTSGQNGVSGGHNFFCTTDGATLFKRNLTTGALISSATIPAGVIESNSGIIVDNCNNIYVGSSNAIIQFDSSLNAITFIPTTGSVYCLAPGKNGELLACGDGFIGVMNASICRSIFCDSTTAPSLTVNFVAVDNSICPGTCVSFTNLSINASTYQWSFPGGSPSTSTDINPQNICYDSPGTYDVMLIGSNGTTTDTLILSSYITVYPAPAVPAIMQGGDTLFATQGNATYQWFFGSDTISGATNYFYVAPASGNYNLAVTDSNGCPVAAGILNVIASSESGVESLEFGVGVFPNPAKDEFTVYGLPITNCMIELFNSIGERVILSNVTLSGVEGKANSKQSTVNCKHLPSGIYLLKISSGEKIITRKIVIEK